MNYMGSCQCRNCGKMLAVKISEGMVQEVFLIEVSPPNLPNSIPQDIRNDFNEAVKCFNIEAYTACVIMCRRTIESFAVIKGAGGSTLYEKLTDLYKKRMIDKATYHLATGIRQFGGYGAHPQDDYSRHIDRGIADIILKVTERIIKELS